MISRKWIASGFVLAIAVTGVTAGAFMAPRNANGEETPPYITDVNNRLDNHEARITNNESDIKALQDNTGTAPSEHVSVPSSSTPTSGTVQQTSSNTVVAEPTPAPTPVVVPVVAQYFFTSVYKDCNDVTTTTYTVHYSDNREEKQSTQPTGIPENQGRYSYGYCSNKKL